MTESIATLNGNGLNDEQAKAVEAGLAMHLRVQGQLTDAQHDNARLREAIAQALTQIETLRSWNNHLESQVETAIARRDQAVAERAAYEVLFSGIMAQMREFRVPAVPLIREKAAEIGD